MDSPVKASSGGGNDTAFNSIEWILGEYNVCPGILLMEHGNLSIPLNGFPHEAVYAGAVLSGYLSIPLNGFCISLVLSSSSSCLSLAFQFH
jgi:hypothetical protein